MVFPYPATREVPGRRRGERGSPSLVTGRAASDSFPLVTRQEVPMAPSSPHSLADLARSCLTPFLLRGVLPVVLLGVAAAPALAQGLDEYCNFEAPQVKPIAIAELPG